MAISVYTGVMGSGKTYEVVGHVIAPALAAGRRVVTNIAGFDYSEAVAFCVERYGVKAGDVGELVQVDDDEVAGLSFFPAESLPESTVRPGDLVVIDECWRFFGTDAVIRDPTMEFLRKHRHLTDPVSGVSCDVVLITQAVADLHRKVRVVVEVSFRAKKAKGLGFNSVYVVEMWEGTNQRRRSVSAQTRKYDKSVFPLYKSYSGASGAAGREVSVDRRQNVLRSFRFLVVVPGALLFLGFAIWRTYGFFAPPEMPVETPIGSSVVRQGVEETSLARDPVGPVLPVRAEPSLSQEWRLSGFVAFGERRQVIVINRQGRLRYVSPGEFAFVDGKPVSGLVDGDRVTAWTGGLPGASVEPEGMSGVLELGRLGR